MRVAGFDEARVAHPGTLCVRGKSLSRGVVLANHVITHVSMITALPQPMPNWPIRSSGVKCPPRPPPCSLFHENRRPMSRVIAGSEEHTSELQSLRHLVCRLLLEK